MCREHSSDAPLRPDTIEFENLEELAAEAFNLVPEMDTDPIYSDHFTLGYLARRACATITADAKTIKQLREALIEHRIDMHEHSKRPCDTCKKSAEALGIADMVPNHCAYTRFDKDALLAKTEQSKETDDDRN